MVRNWCDPISPSMAASSGEGTPSSPPMPFQQYIFALVPMMVPVVNISNAPVQHFVVPMEVPKGTAFEHGEADAEFPQRNASFMHTHQDDGEVEHGEAVDISDAPVQHLVQTKSREVPKGKALFMHTHQADSNVEYTVTQQLLHERCGPWLGASCVHKKRDDHFLFSNNPQKIIEALRDRPLDGFKHNVWLADCKSPPSKAFLDSREGFRRHFKETVKRPDLWSYRE